MTIRAYTPKGKEMFFRVGQVVPAGFFDQNFQVLERDHVVNYAIEEGNPWDQDSRDKKRAILTPKKN